MQSVLLLATLCLAAPFVQGDDVSEASGSSSIISYNLSGVLLDAPTTLGDITDVEISTDPNFSPIVTTFAGSTEESGTAIGERLSSQFDYPFGVARNSEGSLFIADTFNDRICMIATDGIVSVIGGSAEHQDYVEGPGNLARFNTPTALAVGSDGTLYVSDTGNHVIRKLSPPVGNTTLWTVTTLAGTGTPGFFDGSGRSAQFISPQGLALDSEGNLYVADTGNHRIRVISTGSSPTVSTLAGTSEAGDTTGSVDIAQFNAPTGLAFSADASPALGQGYLYITDRGNDQLRRIDFTPSITGSDTVETLSLFETDDATSLELSSPQDIVVVGDSLYITDKGNERIVLANSADSTDLTAVSFAGSSPEGFANGTADTQAKFNCPAGICADEEGNLFIADADNHLVRRIVVRGLTVAAEQDGSAQIDQDVLGLDSYQNYHFRWLGQGIDGSPIVRFVGGESFYLVDPPTVDFGGASFDARDTTTLTALVGTQNDPTTVIIEYSTDPELQNPFVVSTLTDSSGSLTLGSPSGIAVDNVGNLYLADSDNHRIYKLSPPAGEASGWTLDQTYGDGTAGFVDSDAANNAQFDHPTGLTYDATRNCIFVADELNHRIRRIDCDDDAVTTVAGSGVAGFADADNATEGQFLFPTGLAIFGNTLYVADRGNHRIRAFDVVSGGLSTVAGDGNAALLDGAGNTARFNNPTDVTVNSAGNILVADRDNHCIRLVDLVSGNVTLLAGSEDAEAGNLDGSSTEAMFSSPSGLAVDSADNLYVADRDNHLIRFVEPDGTTSTLAGSGTAGSEDSPDSSTDRYLYPATASSFNGPVALALTSGGSTTDVDHPILYLADSGNSAVRQISRDASLPTESTIATESTITTESTNPLVVTGQTTGQTTITMVDEEAEITLSGEAQGTIAVTNLTTGKPLELDADYAVETSANPFTITILDTDASSEGDRIQVEARSEALLTLGRDFLPGETYYFRIRASNARSETVTEIESFTMPSLQQLTVSAGSNSTTSLSSEESTVDFGATPLGTPVTLPLTLSNEGEWPLEISEIRIESAYSVTPTPSQESEITINAGSSFTLEVSLDASAAGSITDAGVQPIDGTLRIISNDGLLAEDSAFEISLTGIVYDPPDISSVSSSDQELTGITLSADVNPNGTSTNVWFEYSVDQELDGVQVTTLGGTDTYAFSENPDDPYGSLTDEGGTRTPSGMAIDSDGNLFFTDSTNHQVIRIATDGTETIFGTGEVGETDGSADTAQFSQPTGLAAATDGTVFVADTGNHRIRAISTTGTITTLVGTGEDSFTDGDSSAVRFSGPQGLAIDDDGLLYVADTGNNRIRVVDTTDGTTSTLDGTGGTGLLNSPISLARDNNGTVYVIEDRTSTIRAINGGVITEVVTLADGSNGSPNPVALAVNSDGSLLVTDQANHQILQISFVEDPATITTLVGTGVSGTEDGLGDLVGIDDDLDATAASLNEPISLALDSTGAILIGQNDGRVRRLDTLTVMIEAATGLTGTANHEVSLSIEDLAPYVTYYLRVVSTNEGGTAASDDGGNELVPFMGRARTRYESWQDLNFGSSDDADQGSPSADPDDDGMPNLLEYALLTDPTDSSSTGGGNFETRGGRIFLRYTREIGAVYDENEGLFDENGSPLGDLVFTIESTTGDTADPEDTSALWSELLTEAEGGLLVEQAVPDGTTEEVYASIPLVTDSAPASGQTEAVQLLRLKVTLQTLP